MKERFNNLRDFCLAIVKAHKEGKPMNPAACSGGQFGQYYEPEKQGEYRGPLGLFATHIHATSMPQLCATINEVLNRGGEIDSGRVYCIRGMVRLPLEVPEPEKPRYERPIKPVEVKDEPKAEEDKTEVQNATVTGEATDATGSEAAASSGEAPSSLSEEESPSNGNGEEDSGEASSEVQDEPEIEAQPENSADESDEGGETNVSETPEDSKNIDVDWEHAEALETKKDLDEYAESLGIKLDRRESRVNMMKDFREKAGE